MATVATELTGAELITFCASNSFLENNMTRRQEEQAEAYAKYLDKDEIKVVLVGTAGPMSPDLAQASTAVF